jgi:putative peptide zinc metalloprotease protein
VLTRSSLTPWLRRPALVTVLCALTLAGLLSAGLVVARAVDGTPATDTTADATNAGSKGDTNVAGAVNTKDGKTVYAIRLKLVQTTADTVDSTNVAAAAASCTDCTTVAIAFEGVLVAGDPATVDPTNLALAYNVNCSGCTTVAEAYQAVVATSTRVRITGSGRREIAAVRQELERLRTQDLSYDDLVARVAALEARFAAVLRTEVVPLGAVHETPAADAPDVSDVVPTPEPSPASSAASSEPGTSAEPTTSASPSDPAAPEVSPSASPAPSP